jgi:hypothetical protein
VEADESHTPDKAAKASKAKPKATATDKADEPAKEYSAAKAKENHYGSELTASQEVVLVTAHKISKKVAAGLKKRRQITTPASSDSTITNKTKAKGLTATSNQSKSKLPKPFKKASELKAEAKVELILSYGMDSSTTF